METVEEYSAGPPESLGLKNVGPRILSLGKLAGYKLGDRWIPVPLAPPPTQNCAATRGFSLCYANAASMGFLAERPLPQYPIAGCNFGITEEGGTFPAP